MVYMSAPDYTSAKWAEHAGIDVAASVPDDEHSCAVRDDESEKFAQMVAKRRQI
jgi:hypothetical protein